MVRTQREQTHYSTEGTSHVSEKMTPTAGAMERMKVQWSLGTMHIVHASGFILNVWV